jgi:hypothetical protein
MRKMPLFVLISVLALLVLIVGVWMNFSHGVPASAKATHGRTVVRYPPGVPAIRPHIAGIPSFTAADVAQYIKTGSSIRTISRAVPAITKTEFITAQQASNLLQGESIGRPDNALVCYVELRGPFHVEGPLPQGASNPTLSTAYELFDAQTGNLLMWGFGS